MYRVLWLASLYVNLMIIKQFLCERYSLASYPVLPCLQYLITSSMQNGGWGIRVSLLQAIKTGGPELLGMKLVFPTILGSRPEWNYCRAKAARLRGVSSVVCETSVNIKLPSITHHGFRLLEPLVCHHACILKFLVTSTNEASSINQLQWLFSLTVLSVYHIIVSELRLEKHLSENTILKSDGLV